MIYVEFSGGLGNQMFAYAFGRAMSLQYREPVTLLDRQEWKEGGPAHTSCALGQLNISGEVGILPRTPDYKRKLFIQNLGKTLMIKREQRGGMMNDWHGFERRMRPLLNLAGCHFVSDGYLPVRRHKIPRDFLAWGYFQAPEYFDSARQTLQRELTMKEALSPAGKAVAEEIEKAACPVCLHWRCGDYLLPENAALQVCTPAYYRRACQTIKEKYPNATLFVFSDSPDYVREQLDTAGLPAVYTGGGRSAVEDMALMERCSHFIISNSTFSWWAQYLAPAKEKTVLAPDRWFSNGRKSALYQDSWTLVKTE